MALLPSAVYQLVKRGHQVLVECGAGVGAGVGVSGAGAANAGAVTLDIKAIAKAARRARARRFTQVPEAGILCSTMTSATPPGP